MTIEDLTPYYTLAGQVLDIALTQRYKSYWRIETRVEGWDVKFVITNGDFKHIFDGEIERNSVFRDLVKGIDALTDHIIREYQRTQ